jgi:hypothetical protein
MHNAPWLLFSIAVVVVVALAAVFNLNGLRFRDRVRKDGRRRLRGAAGSRDIGDDELAGLPVPVQRYLAQAIRDRKRTVQTVRLRHGGQFRLGHRAGWLPVRGEQYFAADPPAFLWWGRLHRGPGVWVDALDQLVDGRASLEARLESTIRVGRFAGPEIDQGGMQRLLGEMVWFPTSFLDDRFVTWEAIDDRTALALLHHRGREVSATFHFRRDGLPRVVTAQRYRTADGKPVLTPWSGKFDDYRLVDGLMVPLEIEARWYLEGRERPYARFKVERIEYDRHDAF